MSAQWGIASDRSNPGQILPMAQISSDGRSDNGSVMPTGDNLERGRSRTNGGYSVKMFAAERLHAVVETLVMECMC